MLTDGALLQLELTFAALLYFFIEQREDKKKSAQIDSDSVASQSNRDLTVERT